MASQQDALYRAVCEYPDEDTPRLIFADFAEEAGDPIRAALIRTQVDLARVPEHDPLWTRTRQSNPNAILGWSLTYSLPELPEGFSWEGHRLRRGFSWQATALDVDALDRTDGALFTAAPIQSLQFDDRCRLHKRMASLAESRHLARIRRLEFTLSRLSPDDIRMLADSPHAANLTELEFANHAITEEGLFALAESRLFTQLSGLTLVRPALPPAAIIDALAAIRPGVLSHLRLIECSLSATEMHRLASLPALKSLEALDLSGNPIRSEGLLSISESPSLARLEVLKLAGTHPGLAGIQRLANSRSLTSLRWLDLSSNRLGPAAARVLAGSDIVKVLRILDLSNNRSALSQAQVRDPGSLVKPKGE